MSHDSRGVLQGIMAQDEKFFMGNASSPSPKLKVLHESWFRGLSRILVLYEKLLVRQGLTFVSIQEDKFFTSLSL